MTARSAPVGTHHHQRTGSPTPIKRFLLIAVLGLLPACNGSQTPTAPAPTPTPAPSEAVFILRACASTESEGEVFRILTRDATVISQATALIGAGNRLIATGPLRVGDGGFNPGWHWHISEDVHFVEVAIELCDGCPHDIEADPDYWLTTVGQFCPWTTEVLGRER